MLFVCHSINAISFNWVYTINIFFSLFISSHLMWNFSCFMNCYFRLCQFAFHCHSIFSHCFVHVCISIASQLHQISNYIEFFFFFFLSFMYTKYRFSHPIDTSHHLPIFQFYAFNEIFDYYITIGFFFNQLNF